MSDHKFTVMQVLPSLESGGVERGTLEVSKALCQAGHRSIVVSAGGRMVPELEQAGAEHIEWTIGKKSLSTFKYVLRLRRYLKKHPVDILHARSRLPAWIAYLAWKGMDKNTRPRFVTTVHGLYSVKKYSSIMIRGEVVIAVSKTVKQYIMDNYPEVPENIIKLIYRGVDADEFPYGYQPEASWLAEWYRQYPKLKDKKVVTLPGRLTRLKGHEDFIKLMAKLCESNPSIMGLIVGGEDPRRLAYAQEIKEKVQAAGLQKNIIFTGYRKDMREIYAISDVVLSLSKKPESFGRTSLEALSLGTPVIAYGHGGVGEILRDVYPSGCVEQDNLNALASRVNDTLKEPTPVPAEHEFKLKNMLTSTLALYEELVPAQAEGAKNA